MLFERIRGALRLAGTAPSAVNKQPWRAVIAGDNVHFYYIAIVTCPPELYNQPCTKP